MGAPCVTSLVCDLQRSSQKFGSLSKFLKTIEPLWVVDVDEKYESLTKKIDFEKFKIFRRSSQQNRTQTEVSQNETLPNTGTISALYPVGNLTKG